MHVLISCFGLIAGASGQHQHVPRQPERIGGAVRGVQGALHPLQRTPPHRLHARRALRMCLEW